MEDADFLAPENKQEELVKMGPPVHGDPHPYR